MAKDLFYVGRAWNPETGRISKRIYFDLDEIPHMILMAPPGGGKGATIENPNRLSDGLRNVNIVGVDPTGQNRAVSGRSRAHFSDIEELNPFELHGRKDTRCNPMLSVKTSDDAMRLAEAVEEVKPAAHEPFWQEGSQGLIGGVTLAVAKDAEGKPDRTPTLEDVYDILTGDLESFAAHMEQEGDYQLKVMLSQFQKENRTIDSIKLHARNALRWLVSEPIRKSLNVKKGEGIDWTRLKTGERPLTVDVILPIDKQITFAPWLKVIAVDALNTLYRLGDVKGRKTVFMLSEFAHYGRVQPFITSLGAGRKFGIRLAPIVLQDSGQLSAIYGKDNATTIIGNCGCLLAFAPAPADNDTARFLSDAAGTHWVKNYSVRDNRNGGPPDITIGVQEEPLWPSDKIRRLPQFHGLLFRSGMPVQAVYCPPYFGKLGKRYLPELQGRYDADPYHPAPVPAANRSFVGQVGKVTGIAAAAAAVIGGGVWLAQAAGYGKIWYPGAAAPVVKAAPPKANPPARVSPKPPHRGARR